MTNDQLRKALRELNAERDLDVVFAGVFPHDLGRESMLHVKRAMLIPDEEDHLVKVTDGKHIYILDAERVAWLRIG